MYPLTHIVTNPLGRGGEGRGKVKYIGGFIGLVTKVETLVTWM
jgi:hypothetical protein